MTNTIPFIIALFSTIPVLTWFVLLIFFSLIIKKKPKAFKLSVDIATFFVIISAASRMTYLWHRPFTGIISLIILLVAFIYTVLYWKTNHEWQSKRLFKGIWRMNFLLFMIGDFILFCYGVINESLHHI
ncbi:DUF3397 domain-containing protein [Scopulibacillus cellulosilyticus]|uniref:DUF3397 domain-containing protein n=1 Tax=Scopulibacillus cellulosilyticus TaxID=2665665 RepID=A0ABW2PVW5_9BACL